MVSAFVRGGGEHNPVQPSFQTQLSGSDASLDDVATHN